MSGDQVRWELGGLIDPRGRLGRVLPAGHLAAPATARVVSDALVWNGFGRSTGPDRHMLEAFVDLADRPASRILSYAMKWGPLFTTLCQCDWDAAVVGYEFPNDYVRVHDHDPDSEHPCRWYLFEQPIWGGTEPLSVWRKYARQARGLLRIAAALNSGSGAGDRHDWDDVYQPYDLGDGYDIGDPKDARSLLSQQLDRWLYISGCRPTVALGTPHPLMFAGDGLFAAIGLQLAFVASVSRGLAICAGCGVVFTPRRLQAGRAAYCRTCGAKTARRDASRRYRERERAMGAA
jgi:hypothetical protein